MPIVIHVGTHKTGTTSIQRFAHLHREALRTRGLWYPGYSEIGLPDHYAHHYFAHAVAGREHRLTRSNAAAFADAIRRRRRPDELVLISAEAFYRHTLAEAGDDHWQARRRFIETMRTYFPDSDTRIVICLRRQDMVARSMFQETVKGAAYAGTFREYLRSSTNFFAYAWNIDAFEAVFGGIDVLVFERLAAEGDLVSAFFARLGVDVAGLAPAGRFNLSLPFRLVEFKRLLNMTDLDRPFLRRLGRYLLEIANTMPDDDRRTEWIDPAEIRAFLATFEPENRDIARRYLQSSADLFPAYGDEATTVFPGLTPAEVAALAATVIGRMDFPRRTDPGDDA